MVPMSVDNDSISYFAECFHKNACLDNVETQLYMYINDYMEKAMKCTDRFRVMINVDINDMAGNGDHAKFMLTVCNNENEEGPHVQTHGHVQTHSGKL